MENFLASKTQRVPLVWISLLRILLGILFLTTWASNLSKGFYTPDGLLNFFTNVFPQANNPLTWYAAFIDGVILPISGVFAPFQLVAEFLIGLFLLLGLLTPLASAGGFFCTLFNALIPSWAISTSKPSRMRYFCSSVAMFSSSSTTRIRPADLKPAMRPPFLFEACNRLRLHLVKMDRIFRAWFPVLRIKTIRAQVTTGTGGPL